MINNQNPNTISNLPTKETGDLNKSIPPNMVFKIFKNLILILVGVVFLLIFSAIEAHNKSGGKYYIFGPVVVKKDKVWGAPNIYTVIKGADGFTFRCIDPNCLLAKDKDNVYSIEDYPKMVNMDADSVTYLGDFYFKDKYGVYFINYKINANNSTFRKIADYYYTDNEKIFYREYEIKLADISSFEVMVESFKDVGIESRPYAKDANNFYFKGQRFGKSEGLVILGNSFFKDSSGIYYHGLLSQYIPTIIKDADPETFIAGPVKIEADSNLAQDKNNLYKGTEIINSGSANLSTFEWLGKIHGKDDKNVYRLYGSSLEIVPDADPSTFSVDNLIVG